MDCICAAVSLCRDWSLLPRDRSRISAAEDLLSLPLHLDSYGEAALEYALRLKEQAGGHGRTPTLRILILTPSMPDTLATNLYAVGADRITVLPVSDSDLFSPERCAALLADQLSDDAPALVITACQDGTGCSSATGVILSRLLRLPYYGPLSDLSLETDGFHIKRALPRYTQAVVFDGPAVCAMGNCEHPYLRMATLREKLSVFGRTPEIAEPFSPSHPASRLIGLSPRQSRRSFHLLPGETAAEQAASLLRLIRKETEADL